MEVFCSLDLLPTPQAKDDLSRAIGMLESDGAQRDVFNELSGYLVDYPTTQDLVVFLRDDVTNQQKLGVGEDLARLAGSDNVVFQSRFDALRDLRSIAAVFPSTAATFEEVRPEALPESFRIRGSIAASQVAAAVDDPSTIKKMIPKVDTPGFIAWSAVKLAQEEECAPHSD